MQLFINGQVIRLVMLEYFFEFFKLCIHMGQFIIQATVFFLQCDALLFFDGNVLGELFQPF